MNNLHNLPTSPKLPPRWDNEYTFELGWSKSGKFPSIEEVGDMWPPLLMPNSNHDEFKLDVYVCRIGNIDLSGDYWWSIGENQDNVWQKIDKNDKEAIKKYWEDQAREIPDVEAESQVNASLDIAFQILMSRGISYLRMYNNAQKS